MRPPTSKARSVAVGASACVAVALAVALAIAVDRSRRPAPAAPSGEGPATNRGAPGAAEPPMNDGGSEAPGSESKTRGAGADPSTPPAPDASSGEAPEARPAGDASEWAGSELAPEARATSAPMPPAAPRAASTNKAQAPPPLTDPLTIEAGRIPGPTLKPASSGATKASSHSESAPAAPAVGLYGRAENALVAGRGQECLALLDRADATPPGATGLGREREQRAASPVVRAQCTMLLGRCDEGVARLRAAGWPDAAVEGARAKFCPK